VGPTRTGPSRPWTPRAQAGDGEGGGGGETAAGGGSMGEGGPNTVHWAMVRAGHVRERACIV
jgi:hypothetical protein